MNMAKTKTTSPTTPSVALLSKIGSALIHAQEFISEDRHEFDMAAFNQLMNDPEVRAWITAIGPLLPVKRKS
jgi:hypothetical protein